MPIWYQVDKWEKFFDYLKLKQMEEKKKKLEIMGTSMQ
jgi:hypothetical protein